MIHRGHHTVGIRRVAAVLLAGALLAVAGGVHAEPQHFSFVCDLDPLLTLPGAFELTPAGLEQLYPPPEGFRVNPMFSWLTREKDRAVFTRRPYDEVTIDLCMLQKTVPVEEVVVDFVKGRLNAITFSIYNRGDAGGITSVEFQRRWAACEQALRTRLQGIPTPRRADPAAGQLAAGLTWFTPLGLAALEKNAEADIGRPEYLRLRIAPRDATGPVAQSLRNRQSSASLTELKSNVVKNGNLTIIRGIPMVDQGSKGYCVVASAQRLFEYYGVSCDQHQLAKIAGTDATKGTGLGEMMKALDKLDQVFHMRFRTVMARMTDGRLWDPKDQRKNFDLGEFRKTLERSINEGVPLLWVMQVGRYPEEPPLTVQGTGNHMRLIIGFDDKSLYFTDSWGAGHEEKKMDYQDAFSATLAVLSMQPKQR